MPVATFEAIVEAGQIRLFDAVRLPERTRVYVVVSDDMPSADTVLAQSIANRDQPVWSPMDAQGAANVLREALRQDKAK